MKLLFIFLIAVSLSMDAFSLALSFGTLPIPRYKKIHISITVGVFHFFMPILGAMFGSWFITKLCINPNLLECIIFFYIAIMMYKDYKLPEEENMDISFNGILIFALGVSLDSFGIGFALNYDIIDRLICSIIFSLISGINTFIGLYMGSKLNSLIGKYSIFLGAIIMFFLAFINFWHFLF